MLSKFLVEMRVTSHKHGGSKKYNRVCVASDSDAAVEKVMQQIARLKGLPTLDPSRVIEVNVREVERDVKESVY